VNAGIQAILARRCAFETAEGRIISIIAIRTNRNAVIVIQKRIACIGIARGTVEVRNRAGLTI
jgi:hypothetical protein